MISAFTKAIAQLPEREFRRALGISLGLSLVTFVVLAVVAWWLMGNAGLLDWPWPLNYVFEAVGWVVFATLTWFLFPAIVSTFVAFFLEGVASAVERKHYPNDPPGKDVPIGRSLLVTVNFTLVLVLVNVVGLLLYVPLMFFPILSFIMFYVLNGYLLGREYFELVALRHLDDKAARAMRRRHSRRIILAGVVIAFLFTIPVVNLLTPLIAAAAMVHVFKRISARPA